MRVRILSIAVSVLLAASLAGCGSSSSSAPGALSEEQRAAVIRQVETRLGSLSGTDLAAQNAELLTFLQGRPEFAETGLSPDGCVWGRFTDGVLYIIANNRPRDGRAGQKAVRAPTELPQGSSFASVNTLGTSFSPNYTEVAQFLTGVAYSGIGAAGATVSKLKQVTNAAVFYIDAHGGSGKDGSGNFWFSVWTATKMPLPGQDPALWNEISSDLHDGTLAIMTAAYELGGVDETHLAITSKFVRKYMSFSANSFLFINACYSANGNDFEIACFEKGASVYAGFTDIVYPNIAAVAPQYVFSRLVGSNAFMPESPGVLPKIYSDIKQEMASMSPRLDFDPVDNNELIFTVVGSPTGDFGLLAPRLDNVQADRSAGTLHLEGVFGQNPGASGTVTVGVTPLSILSWDTGAIDCNLPAGLSGDVVVLVRDHPSNPVTLSGIQIDVLPSNVTVPKGGQFTFAAANNNLPISVTWTSTGGAITQGGVYTAGGAPGSFRVTATSTADPTMSGFASVTIGDYWNLDGIANSHWIGPFHDQNNYRQGTATISLGGQRADGTIEVFINFEWGGSYSLSAVLPATGPNAASGPRSDSTGTITVGLALDGTLTGDVSSDSDDWSFTCNRI